MEYTPLVLDIGSAEGRGGFGGEAWVRSRFPSITGKSKYPTVMGGFRWPVVGDAAQERRGCLSLCSPIEHGIITNWDLMERIWHNMFYNELRVAPEEHHLLMTEPPFNPKSQREKFLTIMFETFNVPAMYVANTSILALYGAGKTEGLVLESGDGVTHAVPIFEGTLLEHAVSRADLGGADITQFLQRILTESNYYLNTTSEMQILGDLKEKLSYIALDFEEEIKKQRWQRNSSAPTVPCKSYELPDGNMVYIDNARFRAPELLFRPSFIGRELCGVHELCYNSAIRCGIDLEKLMFSNVILSGGNTNIPGFENRLRKELMILLSSTDRPALQIFAPPNRIDLPWLGGSVLSVLSSFQSHWIGKDQYDEYGPFAVHRRCNSF